MRLSNKLTFSLVFSVLLIAAFAIVPTTMAAEGGPTIVSIVLDDSQTKGVDADSAATPPTEAIPAMDTVSDGKALLTTTGTHMGTAGTARAQLVDTGADSPVDGTFRLIVTFSEDVYPAATARPDAPDTDPDSALHDQSATRAITADDLAAGDFTVLSALGITTGVLTGTATITDVTRVVKTPADATANPPVTEVLEPRKFYVTFTVTSASYADLPINIALKVNANALFGIGANRVISPFAADKAGLGNVESSQYDFQVIARPISEVSIAGRPTEAIRSHQTIRLTLTFDPALHASDVPTRDNIMVTNGDIKADDESTTDMDEGITDTSPTSTPRTRYVVTILPRGGLGDTYAITVKNTITAAFALDETFQVNNLPEAQRVHITGPTPVPADGAPFAINIVYTVAPATPLTAAGLTVENGIIVANSFSGSGKSYSVRVDPNNPTATTPVTLTVRVGQDFATFTTSVAGTTQTPTPDEPHAATEITLTAGLDAGKYLVVTPAMITYDDPTTEADEGVNDDVLPQSLEAAMRETQAEMPDLEDLLYGGGTIDVYVDAGAGNTPADIIINEVMWALDENEVGADGHTAHQWIELYNNSTENAAAGTITLWFKPRNLSGAPTDEGPRTDRLSNVVRFGTTTGWRLGDSHGQSGNSNSESTKEFISMYRAANKRGDNDGVNGANWIKSTTLSHVKHRGTPGEANTRTQVPVTTRPRPIAFTPPKSHVLINEVHNNSDNSLDWLELRFLQTTKIHNWTLSYVKSDFTEHEIMRFPNRTFAAGDIVLIVNKGPAQTMLAAGQDVTIAGASNQSRGAGPHKYWNPSNGNSGSGHYLDIPDYNSGNFALVLRTASGWLSFGSRTRMHDVVGRVNLVRKTLTAASVLREPHTRYARAAGGDDQGYIWETNTWPINGHNLRAHNAAGSNNDNALLEPDRNFRTGSVWARSGTAHGWRKGGIYNPGNRGGLGYDRNVVASGTPGYDNGIVKGKHTDLAAGQVYVSELMLTTDGGRHPQWIELHNTSDNTVDLHADTDGGGARQGWSIKVENHRSDSWDSRRRDKLHVEVKFRDLGVRFIPPNQTVLIVADKVLNSNSKHFPDHRVGSIWASGSARGAFKMENRRDIFLNPKGFLLQVLDGSGQVSDAVGNLDGVAPTLFNDAGFDDPYSWQWPSQDDMVINNRRTSLIRLYDGGVKGMHNGVPRIATPDRTVEGSTRGAVLSIGMNPIIPLAGYAWVHTVDTKLAKRQITWYGAQSDYATPLHTTGTPLPVNLSFFRPTLIDGQVVIHWTTESELDNAGFNIYRSESRYGEFKQVNDKLIQGKGTTAERSTYKWVDTSAKPGVEYYYQIEDVSFAGERQMLRTTKMKGLISAKDKLTIQWGELKEVQ